MAALLVMIAIVLVIAIPVLLIVATGGPALIHSEQDLRRTRPARKRR